jgi:hypothetical protein
MKIVAEGTIARTTLEEWGDSDMSRTWQMDWAQLPFSDSSGRLEFRKGVPTLLPN